MTEPRPVRYLPGDVLLALHRWRGPVINVGAGRHDVVYLLGPEANKFVFANSDAFSMREAMQVLIPVDGPTALIVSDGDDHRRRRTLVQPALHNRQVQHYVHTMVAAADAVIGPARSELQRPTYPGRPATDLQPGRHPPAAGVVAGAAAIPPGALGFGVAAIPHAGPGTSSCRSAEGPIGASDRPLPQPS